MRVFRPPSCCFMDSMAKLALDMGILWDLNFLKKLDFMGIYGIWIKTLDFMGFDF